MVETRNTYVEIDFVGPLWSCSLPKVPDDIAGNADRESKVDFEEALGRSSSSFGGSYWGNGNVGLCDENEHDEDQANP